MSAAPTVWLESVTSWVLCQSPPPVSQEKAEKQPSNPHSTHRDKIFII